ncbi:hypothetical protein NFI96_018952 [Prochilodus magdalenae]|nr:hypothetical protein NFI96_018952 [Prochilodus magdalenae]
MLLLNDDQNNFIKAKKESCYFHVAFTTLLLYYCVHFDTITFAIK